MSAKLLSLMLCSLTGTLFVYQGQEIGMVNVPREWPVDEYQDVASVNHYRALEARKVSDESLRRALDGINLLGRDNARTPMQWNNLPHAGFTSSDAGPWMRTHDNYPIVNVEKQQTESQSVLNFWKEMLQIRKEQQDLLIHGNFRLLNADSEESFVFTKTNNGRMAVIVLNFTDHAVEVKLPETNHLKCRIGNYEDASVVASRPSEKTATKLRPWEARLYLEE
jgi:alpha-glucosidase